MKFGVVVFPGSNCDDDMIHVLRTVLHVEVEKIWHKTSELKGFGVDDCIVLPGGFSYGDYLRAGAIARFSPIMNAVMKFANEGGMVLGICNGFQILCESGLLPGALLRNESEKFICKNVYVRVENNQTPFTLMTEPGQVLKIPIAHAEGRYLIDDTGLEDLIQNDQILFRYCNEDGETTVESNVNGSKNHIAGISSKNKRVFGLMPHPERASESILGNDDGIILFKSLLCSVGDTVMA